MKLATAVELTQNRKLGPVSATSVSQASCPEQCPFLHKGCYAEHGFQGFTTKRLNRAAGSALQAAEQEAAAIDGLTGSRPLRLHVVGDCASSQAAKLVSSAAYRYQLKAKQPVWSYTHSWQQVKRSAWGGVSVLASCESLAQVNLAHSRGYAAALVVKQHPGKGAYQVGPFKAIPCPNQTVGVQCSDCKLCFRDGELRERGAVISFAAHGTGAKQVRQEVEL